MIAALQDLAQSPFDLARPTAYRRWREGNREQTKVTRIAVRYTFPQELEALLHYNGFTIIRQYGDWSLEPLTAASPSIIVVCRKRA